VLWWLAARAGWAAGRTLCTAPLAGRLCGAWSPVLLPVCGALGAQGVMAMAAGSIPVLTGGRAVLVAVRIGVTVPEWVLAT